MKLQKGVTMTDIQTKNRKIGPNDPTYIVAEMAWSHDGSEEKAAAIIRGAAQGKADAIGIHLTSLPDYMVPHYGSGKGRVSAGKEDQNIYRYLEKINLSFEAWGRLIPEAKGLGLDICVMCNDWPSFDFAQRYNPDIYVISPASFVEEDFVRAQARTGKPLFLRVGGAMLGEIERVIYWAQAEGNRSLVLLFGFQNYPTRIEDSHLTFLHTLRQTFGFQVGLADHLDAEDDLALLLPLLALPLGATVIEKHVTHNRKLKGEDFESALNPEELARMVNYVRRAEKSLGSAHIQEIYATMDAYRQISRKRAVAACTIQAGEVLTGKHIAFKRSDEGISPEEIKYVLGGKAKRELKANEAITLETVM
jgi:sialic acid synthase SpsE